MDKAYFIGFDTSCYTTSVAVYDGLSIVRDERTVLSVAQGNRGLRQSEALFQHVRNLPELIKRATDGLDMSLLKAVSYSASPTFQENSYMPVFLAGKMAASSAAAARQVPLYDTCHQAGHVRAALYGNETLLDRDGFLAIHLSGGTSDMLKITSSAGRQFSIAQLGASSDLHAGQLVDRIGVLLGLAFPAGPHLEKLAGNAVSRDIRIPSCVRGLECSFSGAETKAEQLYHDGAPAEEVAYAIYDLLARSLNKWITNACEETGLDHVLVSGGVASSMMLRKLLHERQDSSISITFGEPRLSSDNAVGVSILCAEKYALEVCNG